MDYTITTTDEQEAALAWVYEQSQIPGSTPGYEGPPPVVAPQTQEQFLQASVDHLVLDVFLQQYLAAVAAGIVVAVVTAVKE